MLESPPPIEARPETPIRPRTTSSPGLRRSGIEPGVWRFLVRFWPLLLFSGYLGFTVFVFSFGPIAYPLPNPWATYGFLAAVHIALVIGYAATPFRIPTSTRATRFRWLLSAPNLIAVSALLNVLLLVPSTLAITGSLDLIDALWDPAGAYRRAADAAGTPNPYAYAIILAAPFMSLAVPLTLFYWRQLSWRYRLFGLTAIGVIWAAAIMLGRNKGFADLVLLGLVFLLVHFFRRPEPRNPRRWAIAAIAGIGVFLLFFAFFSTGTVSRYEPLSEGYVSVIDGYLDYDNFLIRPFPAAARPAIGLFYNYLAQGYYGLSLSLQLDFVWTRGLGSSYFLHSIEEHLFGSEFARTSNYPARVEREFGYGMLWRWHTIHPWLASDLTFPGAVLFVALIGWLLAVSWLDVLAGTNPFAVAVFANLCLMLFYFNANNQVLAFPAAFTATTGNLGLWLITRRASARDRSPA